MCVARVITGWALAGGVVLAVVVAANVASIVGAALFRTPLAADYELTEMGTAIVVFAFLPYAQLHGANVSADIFTARAGPRSQALMAAAGSMAGCAIAAVLLWRMGVGLTDYRAHAEMTAILSIPLWWAFVPVLISLALLLAASLVTLLRALAHLRRAFAGERRDD